PPTGCRTRARSPGDGRTRAVARISRLTGEPITRPGTRGARTNPATYSPRRPGVVGCGVPGDRRGGDRRGSGSDGCETEVDAAALLGWQQRDQHLGGRTRWLGPRATRTGDALPAD